MPAVSTAFLIFVLALGVIVHGVSERALHHGRRANRSRQRLPALLATAAVSAVLANLVNHLPATLIILPVAAASSGPAAVLVMLIGVNLGPNLTYVGSLATLLWRRVMHARLSGVS